MFIKKFRVSIGLSVIAYLRVSFMNPGYVTNDTANFNYDLELQPKSKESSTTIKKSSS